MAALRKSKIRTLDIYRAICILAVVLIHVTSLPAVRAQRYPDSPIAIFYLVLNQFSQFAVPSFLFLSGLVLFYNYWSRSQDSERWIGTFYKKRLMYVVIPYLLWSGIYFVFKHAVKGNLHKLREDTGKLLAGILYGDNFEHLYYFVILIQFYLIFPLLVRAVRSSLGVKMLVPAAVLVQILFYFFMKEVLNWDKAGDLFITYFLQFSIGAYVGISYEAAMGFLRRWRWLCYATFVLFGFVFVFAGRLYYQWLPELLPYKEYLNFVIYYVFTSAAALSLLLISEALYQVLQGRWLARLLTGIGIASFAIFLVHPLLLSLWRQVSEDVTGGPLYHLMIWAGGAVVLMLSWGFYILMCRLKWSRILIGK
ncbi:acyltransferase [Paenibacillus sp. CAA11]|uniref:acyltransferase n=1 Tax=Paenibacillus sp. CAA11 TaxID=1532905 RepID=UPI00131F1076|nr:acyltransferase [Paenibacillus sp. CAA11]